MRTRRDSYRHSKRHLLLWMLQGHWTRDASCASSWARRTRQPLNTDSRAWSSFPWMPRGSRSCALCRCLATMMLPVSGFFLSWIDLSRKCVLLSVDLPDAVSKYVCSFRLELICLMFPVSVLFCLFFSYVLFLCWVDLYDATYSSCALFILSWLACIMFPACFLCVELICLENKCFLAYFD